MELHLGFDFGCDEGEVEFVPTTKPTMPKQAEALIVRDWISLEVSTRSQNGVVAYMARGIKTRPICGHPHCACPT